jgi:probable F420-dependent oxidoreductase
VTDHPIPEKKWLDAGGHCALDPFVPLSFAAAATSKMKLHTNLIVLAYRSPFLTAKSIASLDRLSDGRVIMGVGSGYLEPEFNAMGADFASRGALTDEAIEVMKKTWTGEVLEISGRGFKASGVISLPTPLQKPHPPIWVGGNSDRAMRRAVESCDGWSPFPAEGRASVSARTAEIRSIDDLRAKIEAARELAAKIGRKKPLEICMVPFGMTPHKPPMVAAAVLDQMGKLAEIGVTWCALNLPTPNRKAFIENVQRFGEDVIAKLPGRR